MINKTLRTHIKGTPNRYILEGMLSLDGKSEVTQLERSILNKDIADLQIPMDYS